MKVHLTSDTIRIEITLPVPVERAWQLLTEAEHLSKWWGDHVELTFASNGTFMERWSDGEREVVTSGEVTQFEPLSLIEMSWADDDWPGPTTVSFRLSADGEQTRLVLEHAGWEIHAEEGREALIDAHASGWTHHVSNLHRYASEQSDAGPHRGAA